PADVIAGGTGTGSDSLAAGTGENGAPGIDRRPPGHTDGPPPARHGGRRGGWRGIAILVILLLLIAGGGYATWPMWRDQVAPYAEQFGIELPGQQVADVPADVPPAESPAAQPPAPTSPSASPSPDAPS